MLQLYILFKRYIQSTFYTTLFNENFCNHCQFRLKRMSIAEIDLKIKLSYSKICEIRVTLIQRLNVDLNRTRKSIGQNGKNNPSLRKRSIISRGPSRYLLRRKFVEEKLRFRLVAFFVFHSPIRTFSAHFSLVQALLSHPTDEQT